MQVSILKALSAKTLPKSLWVYHTNTGACNGCDIEIINVLTPYYDAERFGIKLVGSPRHADVLLVSGPVTRQVLPALKRLYEAVPDPKLVFAFGSCSVGGGIWYDSYNIIGGADKAIPVDYYVPGCPPRPEAILYGVAVALGLAPPKVEFKDLAQDVPSELVEAFRQSRERLEANAAARPKDPPRPER
ncbi:MAG: NADH-quinone oxidoreductase subunit B family protein [Armatimonadota bacterium]|nr:MAG: NADH-quinone oxidoreductase subunit B family protein [Armatimonadota bacterium]